MSDRFAPEGKIWMCGMCGKKARDQFGEEGGWDESCAMNSYLVDEANPVLDPAMVQADWEKRIADCKRRCDELREQIENGTWQPDPELMALAEQIVGEMEQGRA